MERTRKPSREELRVVGHMLTRPESDYYGLEIAKATGIRAGTLYPILRRLEQKEWLSSDWERVQASEAGRPRRRYYRLTPRGAQFARESLEEFLAPIGKLVWQA